MVTNSHYRFPRGIERNYLKAEIILSFFSQDKNSIFLYLFSKGILLCPKPGCIKILEDMSKLNFSPDELLIWNLNILKDKKKSRTITQNRAWYASFRSCKDNL